MDPLDLDLEPELYPIKGGWAAHHPTEKRAVHGATQEEAREKFRESQEKNRRIQARIDAERAAARCPLAVP